MIAQKPASAHKRDDAMLISRDEALSSEALFRQEVNALHLLERLTQEEEAELVNRAREGSREATEEVLLRLLPYIQKVAGRYARTYAWASPRIEYLDLINQGFLAALENLEHALASAQRPCAYLCTIASRTIVRQCRRYASAIMTPDTKDGQPLPYIHVDSLDLPLSEEEEESTLADLIPASKEACPQLDYTLLHQAVEALPEKRRDVIKRHYGFGGEAVSLWQINQEKKAALGVAYTPSSANYLHQKALAALRSQLSGWYA